MFNPQISDFRKTLINRFYRKALEFSKPLFYQGKAGLKFQRFYEALEIFDLRVKNVNCNF